MLGITLEGARGIGDKLQFASFPENYFRNTGQLVVDLDRSWIFDCNPYVIRNCRPSQVVNLWSAQWNTRHGTTIECFLRKPTWSSIAERTSSIFGHVTYLRHPRLYRFEGEQGSARRLTIHTTGSRRLLNASAGEDHERILSTEVIDHVKKRYSQWELIQVGGMDDVEAGVGDFRGLSIWQLVELIATSTVFVGVDSGPSWIAACYPQVFRKTVLMQYSPAYLRDHLVPMSVLNRHWHWHDASSLYFNRSPDDAGMSYGYTKL